MFLGVAVLLRFLANADLFSEATRAKAVSDYLGSYLPFP